MIKHKSNIISAIIILINIIKIFIDKRIKYINNWKIHFIINNYFKKFE